MYSNLHWSLKFSYIHLILHSWLVISYIAWILDFLFRRNFKVKQGKKKWLGRIFRKKIGSGRKEYKILKKKWQITKIPMNFKIFTKMVRIRKSDSQPWAVIRKSLESPFSRWIFIKFEYALEDTQLTTSDVQNSNWRPVACWSETIFPMRNP